MARPSQVPKTPEAQVIQSDEVEEEDVDDGVLEESLVDSAANGKVLHLGSDLPDPPTSPSETRSSPRVTRSAAPLTKMGAEQSREVNDLVHGTSHDLLKNSAAPPKSAGKLNKLKASNPPYQNPVNPQRKLGQRSGIRKSVYELGDSPEKVWPARTRGLEQAPQISPRRGERKKTTAAKEQPEALTATQRPTESASPRKSRRQQALPAEAPAETINPTEVQGQTTAAEGEGLGEEDARFKSWFPEVQVAAGAEDDIGENIDVAEPEENAPGGSKDLVREVQRRSGSRPRKNASIDATTGKRKPGRPSKKSDARSSDQVTQAGNDTAPKTAGRRARHTEDAAAPEEPSTAVSRRQTRQQTIASQSPRKRKSRGEAAVSKPNKRRRGKSTGNVEQQSSDPDDEDYEQVEEEAEDDVDEILQDQPRIVPRIERVHAGQLFSDVQDGLDILQSSPEKAPGRQVRSKKQKGALVNSAPANTGRKRRRAGEQESDREEEIITEDDLAQRRLFGQWLKLQKICKDLDKIGCTIHDGKRFKNHVKLEDEQIEAIVDLCKDATQRFQTLRNSSGSLGEDADPAIVLQDISDHIDDLQDGYDECRTISMRKRKSTCVYYHLIPELVKLVRHAVICYLAMDKDAVPLGQIKINHLDVVADMIGMAIDLINDMENQEKPATNLHLVQPVRNNVRPPLRKMLYAFNVVIQNHQDGIRNARRQQEEARQRALRLEQEERQSRHLVRIRKLQDKWCRLHEERMWAEGGLMKPKKRAHLEIPSNPSNSHRELDQNGRPFSREEGLVPRVGPAPGMVDVAAGILWSDVELNALINGLEQYTGPNVFEKIFRRYCWAGKELNRFNVTEIVTTAAMWREIEVATQKEDPAREGVVQDWVLAIPVWTKGQPALGKENEDGVVDLTVET